MDELRAGEADGIGIKLKMEKRKMSEIKDAWEKARLAYQERYAKACEEFEESKKRDTEFYQGQHNGAVLEMSWVLIEIFGLTGKQVEEVERNKGFTNADIN